MADDCTIAHLAENISRESDYAYNGFRVVDGGIITDRGTSTKVGVFLSPLGEMAVIFEGSKQPLDWYLNSIVYLKEYGDAGRVHAGFLRSWLAVQEQVIEIIARYSPDKLIVGGHSRGGGIAPIASLELRDMAPAFRVVTFGAPRPGNRVFAKIFREKVPDCTRYWLAGDPVPFLPFLKWRYRQIHGGRCLWAFGITHIMKTYVAAISKRH